MCHALCQHFPSPSCCWHRCDATLQVGRERPAPRLTQGLSWDWKAGRAASLEVGSPRSVLAREPETNAQSEYKRQLSGGLQAWQGPTLSLPISSGLAGDETRAQGTQAGLAVPSNPCGQGHASCQLPASSWLKARLEAAVTSTLHK